MTKSDVYSKFEALEEEVGHCYFVFHERFIANATLARFWAEAALDELQHASILRFCREHELLAKIDVDGNIADKIDQLLDSLRKAVRGQELTVDEAFSAALMIESSELDETYEKLTHPLVQAHLLLHEGIQANLRVHHCNFAEAAAEFCKDKAFAKAFRTLAKTERLAFVERGR